MKIFALVMAALVGVMMIANAGIMVVSPRTWFRLPRWIGVHGTLTAEKYASGWGGVQVRLTGAIILAGIVWALCNTIMGR